MQVTFEEPRPGRPSEIRSVPLTSLRANTLQIRTAPSEPPNKGDPPLPLLTILFFCFTFFRVLFPIDEIIYVFVIWYAFLLARKLPEGKARPILPSPGSSQPVTVPGAPKQTVTYLPSTRARPVQGSPSPLGVWGPTGRTCPSHVKVHSKYGS